MTTPSNLYAEKIFSEHPQVLWALDDQADYVSIITESQRDIDALWNVTNSATSLFLGLNGQPFENSKTTFFEPSIPLSETQVVAISPDIVNFADLNPDLKTFTVGTYFYTASPYITSIEIGYEYTDTTSSIIRQFTKSFEPSVLENWMFISETFEIPDEVTTMRFLLKFTIIPGGLLASDYQFYINGLSLGQWCEEFNATSLGVTPIAFPANIAIDHDLAVEAQAYGLDDYVGYYLTDETHLAAKNTSIPIVYGASNITKIYANDNNKPSLILPGLGFLNEVGKYKDYTVEFWARINSDAVEPKRIFGPIASTDGLYVESGFLTLVIDGNFASYFVGEWFRPMLLHIRVARNSASVLLNGEEVISLSIMTSDLSLPAEYNELNKSQDWLGFYAYSDVESIEIDCFAIYPYQVPILMAKRRFAYGQAVASPDSIDAGFNGSSAFIDYPFADYTANYRYPDMARWDQGIFDNLVVTTNSLRTPDYKLPEIFLSDKTLKNLYADNNAIQNETNKFITFRPNSSWNSTPCYFNFPKFNIINDEIHVVYAVVKIKENDLTEQTIIQIYNTITGNYFSIRKDGGEIHYYLYYNGIEEEIYTSNPFIVNDIILVGIDIEGIVESFGGNVATFFGNKNGMKMYIGGDESGIRTFTGNIYSVGLSSNFNESIIENHFFGGGIYGIANLTAGPEMLEHIASYTLLPLEKYSTYFLDIGVYGYWEDYLPLSYFGQFVSNTNGEQYYDLDLLQFNVGYPAPFKSQETVVPQSWTYQELMEYFANPIQTSYAQFDNYLYTNWENYEQLEAKSLVYREFNTTDSLIRSYVTLQYIADGSNALQNYFSTIVSPTEESVIDIDNYNNWNTTKFEVVNNSIIYPTKTVDFEKLSIVSHLEFQVKGILSKPVELKRLEISSQAFSNNTFTSIGTRFGIDMYPYTKNGFYYDYKTKNPFTIYKGSTPYLYLTRDSGIELNGDFTTELERGISIPINKSLASDYKVSAMQLWMLYDNDQFPGIDMPLFNINYKDDFIDFYFVSNNSAGTRAKIYAKLRSTGEKMNGIAYYINGLIVREPVISIKEWVALGIGFSTTANFNSYLGSINLTSPFVFNNISYYKATNLQEVQNRVNRLWLRVKETVLDDLDWQYWYNNYIWNDVLISKITNVYGVDPSLVYSAYRGTNKIIIDDNKALTVNPDLFKVYNDISWYTSVKNPA